MFKKGTSGNYAGRPKNVPDKRSRLRRLLEPAVPELVAKIIKMGRNGDLGACKLILDRTIPPLKADSSPVRLPLDTSATPAAQSKGLISAIAAGRLSIDDAQALMGILMSAIKIMESQELNQRLTKLEERMSKHAR